VSCGHLSSLGKNCVFSIHQLIVFVGFFCIFLAWVTWPSSTSGGFRVRDHVRMIRSIQHVTATIFVNLSVGLLLSKAYFCCIMLLQSAVPDVIAFLSLYLSVHRIRRSVEKSKISSNFLITWRHQHSSFLTLNITHIISGVKRT